LYASNKILRGCSACNPRPPTPASAFSRAPPARHAISEGCSRTLAHAAGTGISAHQRQIRAIAAGYPPGKNRPLKALGFYSPKTPQ
jgi:hypothetical protein